MAMHLLDESLDDSSIGSLIIQRKIKIKIVAKEKCALGSIEPGRHA